MQFDETPRRPRRMNTSNRDARRAVATLLDRFPGWRQDLARFSARAQRAGTRDEVDAILQRCDEIERDLMAVRTELLISLAHAPQCVAGNSRVVDVERALDNTAVALKALKDQLTPKQSA